MKVTASGRTILCAALAGALAACGGGSSSAPPTAPRPQSVVVNLGSHGGTVTLSNQGGSFSLDGNAIASGAVVQGTNGQSYRLTQLGLQWTAEYVPPEPWPVALGTSGDALVVTRQEDGTFRAGEQTFASGDTVTASNGSMYTLTLNGNTWQVAYQAPEPVTVPLGTSGGAVALTRSEDGSFLVNGRPFSSGDIWDAGGGVQYRLTESGGRWTATLVALPPVTVQLGTSGSALSVVRREDGRYYDANGQLLITGDTRRAANGNVYRLSLVDGAWIAEYSPQMVEVRLGGSGTTVTLVREEDGRYWRGRTVFSSGSTVEAADGAVYRLTFAGGAWTAAFVPTVVQVPAGESGLTLTISRSETGAYLFEGRVVRSGDTVVYNGNEYVLTLSGGRWTARFRQGTVDVRLAGGTTITLVKRADGTYTWNGRVIRSGSTYTINGRRYLLTLGLDGWEAVERSTGGGGGTDPVDPPDPGSLRTHYIGSRSVLPSTADVGLSDSAAGTLGSEGTHLVVGPSGNRVAYVMDNLLQRDTVRYRRTYVENASSEIEAVIGRIQQFSELYRTAPDQYLGHSTFGLPAFWNQAVAAFNRIPDLNAGEPVRPWTGTPSLRHIERTIEELEYLLRTLSSRAAFEDEYGRTNLDSYDLPQAVVHFGSTTDTRFGVYANHDESADAWDFGSFAFTPLDPLRASDVTRQGLATYSGDTLALISPSATGGEPATYSGRMTLVANFSSGEVDGTVSALRDRAGTGLRVDGDILDAIELPTAALDDLSRSSAVPGRFSATGRATLDLGTDQRVNASFSGQLADREREAYGVWEVTISTANAITLEGAFGVDRRTFSSSPLTLGGQPRAAAAPGAGDEDAAGFGPWAAPARGAAPPDTADRFAAFDGSAWPEPFDLDLDAVYVGTTTARVAEGGGASAVYSGAVRMDVSWNSSSTEPDSLALRLHDFERESGASGLLEGVQATFTTADGTVGGLVDASAVEAVRGAAPLSASGAMRAEFVDPSSDAPGGAIGAWWLSLGADSVEGSFGAVIVP